MRSGLLLDVCQAWEDDEDDLAEEEDEEALEFFDWSLNPKPEALNSKVLVWRSDSKLSKTQPARVPKPLPKAKIPNPVPYTPQHETEPAEGLGLLGYLPWEVGGSGYIFRVPFGPGIPVFQVS